MKALCLVILPALLLFTTASLHGAERVLIPIAINVEGAYGSRFVTEATVYNVSGSSSAPTTLSVQTVCYRAPCDVPESSVIGPRETRSIPPIGTPGLIISKDGPGLVFYNVRVRDTSRDAKSTGVEIPVVRESEFRHFTSIQDVPGAPRFRSRLRIYALDALTFGTVWLIDPTTDTILDTFGFGANRSANAGADQPYYFERALPTLDRHYRVDIQVEDLRAGGPLPPVWAFITTTNDDTQEITVSSPSEQF